jgi:hypothetical protein
MMKIIIALSLIGLSSPVLAQQSSDSTRFERENTYTPLDFKEVLRRAHMTFDEPEGYKKTKIIPNEQQDYLYALKSPDKKVEVRYYIMPLDSMLAKYNRPREEGETMINPNNIHQTMLTVTMLNISMGALQGSPPDPSIFDSTAVQNEFGADWGATVAIPAGKQFGQDYKFILMVALHKDNLADAYLFYLTNESKEIEKHLMESFHSLRFQ